MSDYSRTMDERPTMLYRKPGTLEFVDRHGEVYAIGKDPPTGYHWRALRKPLNGPIVEVYVLVGEYE